MTNQRKIYLIVVNDGPYGNERPYNALRIAMNLAKRNLVDIRVFLIGDGVQCAIRGQETQEGYYNIERMMSSVVRQGEIGTWEACAKARGLGPEVMIDDVRQGSMDLLTDWELEADHILVF
jgi:uncharacterized protein involved in oxidation of intracellular sulfur